LARAGADEEDATTRYGNGLPRAPVGGREILNYHDTEL
jgi:hypothetical protein